MLTQHDLDQIRNIVKDEVKISEKRILKSVEITITNKIQTFSDQILEYINIVTQNHEEWLRNHENRIKKLENKSIQLS